MTPRVLVVDDDDTLRGVLARELEQAGFAVQAFARAEGVEAAVRREPPDAVLLDLRLPGIDGLELLTRLRAIDEACQVVVLTGHGSIPQAVEAMRRGAVEFLTKPVRLDVLEQVLRQAIEKRALLEDNARLRRALEGGPTGTLIGSSPAMRRLRQELESVAGSDGHVLVHGENGTGKELVARSVHALSRRASGSFVVVNCGAIPVSLFESELFGHEKGAYTGADKRRVGLLEAANGGSSFLDEIGELPKQVQPALLRALQFGEVRRVGSDRTGRVDVRVIAATNRDLTALIAAGQFREDLYYRVSALVLEVPPLRARREDVRELTAAFVARAAARTGRQLVLGEEALARLEEHDWPGNVRELENAIERLSVMSPDGKVGAELVARHVTGRSPARGELPTLDLAELERLAIQSALRRHAGDKKAAAAELGIAFKTLYNKLDRYGLRPPSAAPDA